MPARLKIGKRRTTLRRVRNSYDHSQAATKVTRSYNQGRDVPRRRTEIKASGKDGLSLPARFALHLRELMEEKGWSSRDVAERLTSAGVKIGPRGVDVWLRGEGSPKFRDLELIGRALGFKRDYRKVLPPPE